MNRYEKAALMLAQGRVRVLVADEESTSAVVVGDHGTYRVDVYRDGMEVLMECSCPYHRFYTRRECSHIIAVAKISNLAPPAR